MTNYDEWLLSVAPEPCEPEVIGTHLEYMGDETESVNDYNCENCTADDCGYWAHFNERQAELDEERMWG